MEQGYTVMDITKIGEGFSLSYEINQSNRIKKFEYSKRPIFYLFLDFLDLASSFLSQSIYRILPWITILSLFLR